MKEMVLDFWYMLVMLQTLLAYSMLVRCVIRAFAETRADGKSF
jgi:hypothetical protein